MLNELQFQTGYTSDPRFSSPEPAPSSEPVAVVSSVPEPDSAAETRSAVIASAFDLSSFTLGSIKRGVELSSGVGQRAAPLPGASTNHQGIDLAVPEGTAVYVPLDGTVSAVGTATKRGNYIEIKHEDKFVTRYYHLRDAPTLAKNAAVVGGDQIGAVGSTGNVTGPHLHFEVYEVEVNVDVDDKSTLTRLDPIAWLKVNPTATFPVAVTDQ